MTSWAITSQADTDLNNDNININESINEKRPRLLRGGAFNDRPALVRSAYRNWDAPSNRISNIGFRPARTYP